MRPMRCNVCSLYRRYVSGTEEDGYGDVTETRTTAGPYDIAIVPAKARRTLGEAGYTVSETVALAIAPVSPVWAVGDIISDGTTDLWRVDAVASYPSEQILEVSAV